MAKKIIERIFKTLNIVINILFGMLAVGNAIGYGTDGYMYSDSWIRIIWIIAMLIVVNVADGFIRKVIKEF